MFLHYLYILTIKFLCSGINFDPSGLVTFWFSEGQLLRPLVLFFYIYSRNQAKIMGQEKLLYTDVLEDDIKILTQEMVPPSLDPFFVQNTIIFDPNTGLIFKIREIK